MRTAGRLLHLLGSKLWAGFACVRRSRLQLQPHVRDLMPARTTQGANVADSAFIDTLDVMDCDYLTVGPDAVVGEGTTVSCHKFKDGFISFERVRTACCVWLHCLEQAA